MIIHGKLRPQYFPFGCDVRTYKFTHTRNITDEYFAEKDREKKREKKKVGERYIDANFYK